MLDKMKQLYDMQKQAKQMKKSLEAQLVEKDALNGKLKITMNGAFGVEKVTIDESLLTPANKSTLESALAALMSQATKENAEKSTAQAMDLMKGLNFKLPGM